MERRVTQALDVRDVHASRGSHEVLRGVTIDVAPGEICALMGMSGAGKTTMLRAVAALGPFDSGSIVVDGFALAPGHRAAGIEACACCAEAWGWCSRRNRCSSISP